MDATEATVRSGTRRQPTTLAVSQKGSIQMRRTLVEDSSDRPRIEKRRARGALRFVASRKGAGCQYPSSGGPNSF